MEQNTWNAESCLASQISHILWKPEFHYLVHKSLPHVLPSYLCKICWNIILPPTHRSSKWPHISRFLYQTLYTYLLSHALPTSSSLLWSHKQCWWGIWFMKLLIMHFSLVFLTSFLVQMSFSKPYSWDILSSCSSLTVWDQVVCSVLQNCSLYIIIVILLENGKTDYSRLNGSGHSVDLISS
jgi:hypothetical protein